MNNYPIFAGFWRRGAAIIVDSLILAIPSYALNAMGMHAAVVFLLNVAIGVAYYAGLHSSNLQATIGKRAFGIKVTDLEGKRIGIGRAIGRYFAAWLSALLLGIGFIMAAFTPRRQALHDKICQTLVVDRLSEPDQVTDANGVMEVTWPVWVVVTIFSIIPVVGVVAAIAIPVYQDRLTRGRIVELMAHTDTIKKEIVEATVTRQPLRTGPRPGTSPLVESINVEANGQITITFAKVPLNGGKVFLAPSGKGAAVEWRCWAEGVPQRFMPAVCRE